LEGGTKDEMWIFEALFKGVSTQFGPRAIEKSIENPHLIFCSAFQNLRLGGIKFHVKKDLSDVIEKTTWCSENCAHQTTI
jgi:hypothetical protein